MYPVSRYAGMSVDEWRRLDWWPNGRRVMVLAGWAGHDREITVTIDGYDYREPIPAPVLEIMRAELPDEWKLENRGTRVEIHPSGKFAGGWLPEHVDEVRKALIRMGMTPRVDIQV